ERRTDATGRPNSCQSWAGSISRGRRQCLSLNFGYRPRLCGNGTRLRCPDGFHVHRSCFRILKLGASGVAMHRFIDGEDRMQPALLPHSLEDYVGEENPVRVVEVFIDELDLAALGFSGMTPAATGRPAYHPSTLLKIYLYGYLNRLP